MINTIFYTADFSGCGYIRSIFPLDMLNAVYGNNKIFQGISTPILMGDSKFLAGQQLIRFQKQITPQQVTYIQQLRQGKNSGAFRFGMIYDLDDSYINIPNYHYAKSMYNEEKCKESLRSIFQSVDLVTCSTKYLKIKMQQVKGNTLTGCQFSVLPNLIPKYLYKSHLPKIENLKPKIVWAGSNAHFSETDLGDLGLIYELIKNTQDEFDWILMSFSLPDKFKELKFKRGHWVRNIYDYPRILRSFNADFGIAPLLDNEFNRCKSAIKSMEYTGQNIVSICSDVEPYQNKGTSIFLSGDWKTNRDTIIDAFQNKVKMQEFLDKQNNWMKDFWLEDNLQVYSNMLGIKVPPEGKSLLLSNSF